MNNPTLDYLEGQNDCIEGNPPKLNPSYEYLRGYGEQYEREESVTALSIMEGVQ